MAEHHISLEYPFNRPGSIATVGELTLHCSHLQRRTEMVIALNPNFTAFGDELVESIASGEMLIFDIYKQERHSTTIRGKTYDVAFKTWSKTTDGEGLRFDFVVDEKTA